MRSKKKDLESVIVDTTVQIKNIKHPHDAYLMETAREKIVELCKRLKKELARVTQERDLLKKAAALLCKRVSSQGTLG